MGGTGGVGGSGGVGGRGLSNRYCPVIVGAGGDGGAGGPGGQGGPGAMGGAAIGVDLQGALVAGLHGNLVSDIQGGAGGRGGKAGQGGRGGRGGDGGSSYYCDETTGAGGKTIVIALTAHAFEEERQEILAMGCDDFIRKPYVREDIYTALETHLGIRFIYEEQESSLLELPEKVVEPPTWDALAELPDRIKSDLLERAASLDQDGCTAILERLSATHEEAAAALRTLVENYRFEELENVLARKEQPGE